MPELLRYPSVPHGTNANSVGFLRTYEARDSAIILPLERLGEVWFREP